MDRTDLVHLFPHPTHALSHAGGVTGGAGGHAAEVLLTGIRKRSLLAGFDLDRLGLHRSRGVVAATGRQRKRGEGDKG